MSEDLKRLEERVANLEVIINRLTTTQTMQSQIIELTAEAYDKFVEELNSPPRVIKGLERLFRKDR
ncbi:MAG: hypothetical protein RLZZ196_206 [Bacteroidota bacterium]|jgi:uncharacterized protein (DUF1778 family)